jgi:hypothetical protein
VLAGEEMQRNLEYGDYARREWLALVDQHHIDPLICDGKIAFALERAAHEESQLAALIAKWLPVLQRAANSPVLQGHMDEILQAVGMTKKGKHREDASFKDASGQALVLHMQGLKGLAMATNDHDYEPRYGLITSSVTCSMSLMLLQLVGFHTTAFKFKYSSNSIVSSTICASTPEFTLLYAIPECPSCRMR